MSPQPQSNLARRLPEMDNWQNARERMLSLEGELTSLETELNKLKRESDPATYDDTGLSRRVSDLRYEFDRHTHEEFTRIGGGGTGLSNNPFYTAQKTGQDLTVTVNAGALIRGSNVTGIAEDDVVISSTNGTYYLYLESWYNSGFNDQYSSSTTYPTQAVIDDGGTDFACERFVIAVVVIANNVISSVLPQTFDEIHSTRLWN